MKQTDENGLKSGENEAAISVGLPPEINDQEEGEYEAGKYNNIHEHPGGDSYISDIVGPGGPKTVAKTGNSAIRGGFPDQRDCP